MLTFDDQKHEYRYNGAVVPGVTGILSPLIDLRFVNHEVLAAAQDFGTAVHLACELHDQRRLDHATLDPALSPYLDGWMQFNQDHQCVWNGIEERVYHPTMRYAGTLDRRGKVDGRGAIVDIKSGTSLFASVGPQLAAYSQAIAAQSGRAAMACADQRFAVRLFPGGYELKQYTSPMDWAVFASLITLRNFCSQHTITPNFKELSYD